MALGEWVIRSRRFDKKFCSSLQGSKFLLIRYCLAR